MSGLALKLAPKERILINGAVIENGNRRFSFTITTPNTKVLKLKDAISPERSQTPLGRICYNIQLILTGDASKKDKMNSIFTAIDTLSSILEDKVSQQVFHEAKSALSKDKPYTALKLIKQLLPLESHLLELHLGIPVSSYPQLKL